LDPARNARPILCTVAACSGKRKGPPDKPAAFAGITHDAGLRGLGVVATKWLGAEKALVCLMHQSELKILKTELRNERDLGGGWFRIGLEATGALNPEEHPEIRQFAEPVLCGKCQRIAGKPPA
jgi:hypothetical protein